MNTDKVWIDFWGRPAWRWSLDTLLANAAIERVVVVAAAESVERFRDVLPAGAGDRPIVVEGGETRADSVIAGLWALTGAGYDDATLVLVHDAARPAISAELVAAVVDAVAEPGGERAVVPVVPVVDSLKQVRGDRVVAPVDRDEIAAAQTPQAAPLGALRAAIEEAHAWGRPITDDAGALAAAGVPVHAVRGDSANRKLTSPDDVVAMRGVLASRVAGMPEAPALVGARAGIGFDAHRLAEGRPMRLAGVTWDGESRGPVGHSDGDAALHALIDALLGAGRLGDIGALYPSDGPDWEGADSTALVELVVIRLRDAGLRPLHADLVVAAARPAIATRRDELAARIASLLGVDSGSVSIKGTTSDGLGFAGDEGVAAWAVASVEPIP